MPNPYALGMREKGITVPISIATALAIESALGVYPDKPVVNPMPLKRYQMVWLNVYTLYRNLIGSMKTEDREGLLPAELVSALKEDILIAKDTLEKAHPEVKVVFYLNDYRKLEKKYPNASLKTVSTPAQLESLKLEKATLELLVKDPPVTLERYDLEITGQYPMTLIVTHYAVDLFAKYSFRRLDLLESHTGEIKPAMQWNTKLGVKEGREHLPFNAFTLQVYGDRSIQFAPQPLPLRRAIMKLAQKDMWNVATTMDRIKSSIKRSNDAYLMVATRPFL